MAAMSDMPYLIGNMMTICSWHKSYPKRLKQLFHLQKEVFKPIFMPEVDLKPLYFKYLPWCDPN